MNILVIGNGFDIAHDLKTSYGDYLDYVDDFSYFYREKCEKKSPSFDIKMCKSNNNTHFIELFNKYYSDEDIRKIIDEQNGLITGNVWISYFRECQTNIGNRWVDFESEILHVIKVLDEVRNKILIDAKKNNYEGARVDKNSKYLLGFFRKNPSESRWSLNEVNDIKQLMLTDLNRLTRSYEIYITLFINQQTIKEYLPVIVKMSIDRVLSFNYSDTYEKWYSKDKTDIEYDYIHGKAGIGDGVDTCNLVLGINEYLNEPERTNDNEFIEFKKFYQRIYKKTGNEYLSWIENINTFAEKTKSAYSTQTNIYFYGHSLDITDGDIIAKLIRIKNATTSIYYHDKKALANQIANLVKILGEEELINRTGHRPSLVFKPCNE